MPLLTTSAPQRCSQPTRSTRRAEEPLGQRTHSGVAYPNRVDGSRDRQPRFRRSPRSAVGPPTTAFVLARTDAATRASQLAESRADSRGCGNARLHRPGEGRGDREPLPLRRQCGHAHDDERLPSLRSALSLSWTIAVVSRRGDQAYPAVMSPRAYASVNGLQMYYEVHGSGSPLVLLHGGALTIDLSFGP